MIPRNLTISKKKLTLYALLFAFIAPLVSVSINNELIHDGQGWLSPIWYVILVLVLYIATRISLAHLPNNIVRLNAQSFVLWLLPSFLIVAIYAFTFGCSGTSRLPKNNSSCPYTNTYQRMDVRSTALSVLQLASVAGGIAFLARVRRDNLAK